MTDREKKIMKNVHEEIGKLYTIKQSFNDYKKCIDDILKRYNNDPCITAYVETPDIIALNNGQPVPNVPFGLMIREGYIRIFKEDDFKHATGDKMSLADTSIGKFFHALEHPEEKADVDKLSKEALALTEIILQKACKKKPE